MFGDEVRDFGGTFAVSFDGGEDEVLDACVEGSVDELVSLLDFLPTHWSCHAEDAPDRVFGQLCRRGENGFGIIEIAFDDFDVGGSFGESLS